MVPLPINKCTFKAKQVQSSSYRRYLHLARKLPHVQKRYYKKLQISYKSSTTIDTSSNIDRISYSSLQTTRQPTIEYNTTLDMRKQQQTETTNAGETQQHRIQYNSTKKLQKRYHSSGWLKQSNGGHEGSPSKFLGYD